VLSGVPVVVPTLRSDFPPGIALSILGTLAGAVLVVRCGLAAALRGESASLFAGFAWGLLAAGAISGVIGLLQVFVPEWTGGDLIARSGLPGRAVGNLRQPNHLASLLVWSIIAAIGLFETRRLSRMSCSLLCAFLTLAVVLSGSRTGALGLLVLAGWGLCDRRLSLPSRFLLGAIPVFYAASWTAMWIWAHAGGHTFGAEGRMSFSSSSDISSSRFAIWSNAWQMAIREPLLGVGIGEFNLAWTLSQFPDRPVAFFDHTHNLPLQLVVELGFPLAAVVLGLLLAALLQAFRRSWQADGDQGTAQRTAFMLVTMISLHSLLEYPLWYAYFLLPASYAWGFSLARPATNLQARTAATAGTRGLWPSVAIGLTMTIGASAAVLDYYRIAIIYEPPTNAAPLEERIALGQRSLLFGHHADYAAATAFGEPRAPLSESQALAFKRAPHHLLDIRLMIAWSQALVAQGEVDKARWLAARIREFRNPGADEYFEPCANPTEAAHAFQCQAPQRTYHWREFVSR